MNPPGASGAAAEPAGSGAAAEPGASSAAAEPGGSGAAAGSGATPGGAAAAAAGSGVANVAAVPGAPGVPDTITLTGLRAHGRHGVYPTEREQGQEFVVDVVLELDLSTAGRTDALADTVDYGRLASALVAVVTGPPVRLIETLATRLAEQCLADRRVAAATVTVHKPQAPIPHPFTDVAITRRVARSAAEPA